MTNQLFHEGSVATASSGFWFSKERWRQGRSTLLSGKRTGIDGSPPNSAYQAIRRLSPRTSEKHLPDRIVRVPIRRGGVLLRW